MTSVPPTSRGTVALDIRFDVVARPTAPAEARRRLAREVGSVVPDDHLEILKLLVTELVTNALRHSPAGGRDWRIAVDVECSRSRVRVAVRDPGRGFERRAPAPGPYDVSGRGLFLVDRLADRWGVDNAGGTCVWFELHAADVGDSLCC
ncbi:MAG TPA: ATP-binding protein [Actinomycetota bacterium]|nr:ATP-binding protein [Actinomycetota bacterium]